ncbi:MAG: transcription-repair coupling factor [Armatimonadetes bacterium]|nr:transcription-repair coupling factor [Armatimonadota bacterium]
MTASELHHLLDRLPGVQPIKDCINATPYNCQVDGLAGPAKSLLVAHLTRVAARQVLFITYNNDQAQRVADDLLQFGLPAEQVLLIPAPENLLHSADVTDRNLLGERITALCALASGESCVVVGTAEAILQRTSPPQDIIRPIFKLAIGQAVKPDELSRNLTRMGYEACSTVTLPGTYSRRGGILDIFPTASSHPIRLEMFGDEIESLRVFDISTQRSIENVAEMMVTPAREIRLTSSCVKRAIDSIKTALAERVKELMVEGKSEAAEVLSARVEADLDHLAMGAYFPDIENYLPFLVPETVCALDYLKADGLIVVDEPDFIQSHWERLESEITEIHNRQVERGELLGASRCAIPLDEGLKRIHQWSSLTLNQLPHTQKSVSPSNTIHFSSTIGETFRSKLNFLAGEAQNWIANEGRVVILTSQPHRLNEICAEFNLPVNSFDLEQAGDLKPGLYVLEGTLRQGFKWNELRLNVITDAELFGSSRPIVSRRRFSGAVSVSSILDLREGDYVVHIHHGIGIYRGMTRREVMGAERDYLLIEYAEGDRLFVPADQIDRVQRYIGTDGVNPTIHRIGGSEWHRTTRKVREQARYIAKDLIQIYAARLANQRDSYGDDTPWQQEMEDAFPYEETLDQRSAIQEVKGDLESNKPMDRLICGDVGYGKTEVAIRAAFKVAESGKQVAVLCPTTVLAAQHLTTFTERLAAYPVRVELLSRFRSRQEQTKTIEGLKSGAVDIVVGTHRLLAKDVIFKNLGLVIIDEEQRFGVAHKERLKKLRTTVDVLTLSATPIPRTLSMALSGLREMSVIEEPPAGRMPIITYCREHDDELIRDAILREIEREGQVYYVYNRVENIAYVAQRLQRLVPDARIRIGHGQMSEDELEKVMLDFYHHEYDMLVCTTIIENGLDIPNVNTIIVENADRLGLAQLYQLRGRVGRSSRQAYAYLLYRAHKRLTDTAEKRLMAIKEFTALGTGYQLALRDLEIRGAGNLLGAEQHGAMAAVGFDLYCQILAQAVGEVRGDENAEQDPLPPVDLPVTAHIPDDYIPSEAERIYFYKRISGMSTDDEITAIQEEMEDRYGDPPHPVWNALAVLRLRMRARETGIMAIKGERYGATCRFSPQVRLSAEAVRLLNSSFRGHRFTADSLTIPYSSANVLSEVERMVDVIYRAINADTTPPPAQKISYVMAGRRS